MTQSYAPYFRCALSTGCGALAMRLFRRMSFSLRFIDARRQLRCPFPSTPFVCAIVTPAQNLIFEFGFYVWSHDCHVLIGASGHHVWKRQGRKALVHTLDSLRKAQVTHSRFSLRITTDPQMLAFRDETWSIPGKVRHDPSWSLGTRGGPAMATNVLNCSKLPWRGHGMVKP